MSLVSPTGLACQRRFSVSSTTWSDGYHSEVFDDDEMRMPPMSENLTSLINGPLDMTNKFTNEVRACFEGEGVFLQLLKLQCCVGNRVMLSAQHQ